MLYHACLLIFLCCSCLTSPAQNVGIGTLTPNNKLSVEGDGSFRTAAMSVAANKVNGGGLLISNTNGNQQTLRLDGSNIQSTYSDPFVFPPANLPRPLVLNPYGGNVGIGTNFTPEYKLHLWSNSEQLMKIDGSNSLVLFHDNTSNAQYGFLRAWTSNPFNPVGYYGLEIGTPPSAAGDPLKRLMFSTNYNLRLTIMEDGKIGLNTAAPNSTLQVNGSMSMPIKVVTLAGSASITDDDYSIIADMENNPNKTINLVLPSAMGRRGRLYHISAVNVPSISYDATIGLVNIFDNGPGLLTTLYDSYFAGFSPYRLDVKSATFCTVQSDGAKWYIIASNYYRFTDTN